MADIRIYGTNSCAWCGAARMLLKRKGLDFEDVLVGDLKTRREMEQLSGRRSVPQIFIGTEPIGGYDDLVALERSGELDRMIAKGRGPST
jgi:glutaredoxin 3